MGGDSRRPSPGDEVDPLAPTAAVEDQAIPLWKQRAQGPSSRRPAAPPPGRSRSERRAMVLSLALLGVGAGALVIAASFGIGVLIFRDRPSPRQRAAPPPAAPLEDADDMQPSGVPLGRTRVIEEPPHYPDPPPQSGAPFGVGAAWVGTMVCGGGTRRGELHVTALETDGLAINGVARAGGQRWRVAGVPIVGRGETHLFFRGWHARERAGSPEPTMVGNVDETGRVFAGTALPLCESFSLRRP